MGMLKEIVITIYEPSENNNLGLRIRQKVFTVGFVNEIRDVKNLYFEYFNKEGITEKEVVLEIMLESIDNLIDGLKLFKKDKRKKKQIISATLIK